MISFDSIVLPREIDPKLGPKNRLRGAEKLYTGELKGAESFDSYNGKLYSGIYGGYVVRLEEDRVVPVVKFGKKCGELNMYVRLDIYFINNEMSIFI